MHSVVNKIDELRATVFDIDPDIICLTETWTHEDHTKAYLAISGYEIICRRDRTDTQSGCGGGLLLYAKSDFSLPESNRDIYDSVNQCCAAILPMTGGSHVELVLAYRPHKLYDGNSTSENNDAFASMFKAVQKPSIIIGDFNFKDIDWNTYSGGPSSKAFMDSVNSGFFTQHVDFPTQSCGNILDLVFSSRANLIASVSDVGKVGKSDHSLILVELSGSVRINKTEQEVPDWGKADMGKLVDLLAEIDWEAKLQGTTQESWDIFKSVLDEVQTECVPKKVRRSIHKPLWLTRNVLRIIRKKRRLWRTYSATKDYQDFQAYREVEKHVQKAVRRAKCNFEKTLAKNSKSNPKAFYSYLKSCNANKEGVGPLKEDGRTVNDNSDMADMFNNFFASVFTDEDTNSVPEPRQTFDPGGDPLSDIVFMADTVRKKINNIRIGAAPGPDNITPRFLHATVDVISVPLAIIFTKSFEEGTVPDDWRQANITPIFKKGSKSVVGNYRPVSLTSVVCKIMESVIKDAIVKHMIKHKIINESQHGFVPGKSCLTNLLEYLDRLTEIVDSGQAADIIYLDFAKAFDKVPHCRLLAKVRAAGITGNALSWIQAWLHDRKQRVVLNGNASGWKSVRSGVPQGSVLGPILFVIFINDIDDSCSDATFLSKFADDTKAVHIIKGEADRANLQMDIDNLVSWSDEWQMLFNADKCKVVHIGKNNPGFSYTMGGFAPAGSVLGHSVVEKDLGVLVSSTLKPSEQCAAAAKKANQVLGQMARSLTYRDKHTWLKLYRQYVRPHLEYCIQAWCPWNDTDIDALEQVQRRAIGMTSGFRATSYEDRLQEVGMMTLKERRKRGDMIEVWKIVNDKSADCNKLFTMTRDHSQRDTRASTGLNITPPKTKLEIRRQFFSSRVVNPWNSLPLCVKLADSVDTFKLRYDEHIGL